MHNYVLELYLIELYSNFMVQKCSFCYKVLVVTTFRVLQQ